MKKHILWAIIIIALFVTCSNKKTNPDNRSAGRNNIAVQVLHFPESGEDTLKASYFADTVIYIPLETTKESLVDYIYQLWMDDTVIIVNCRNAGLLMFQINGKFVRKIGKQGKGPGEYGIIFNFEVIRDTIYVSSSGRRGFLRYTFDDTFCGEIKFKYQPAFCSSTADLKLACYVREEGKVLVYNKNLNTPDTIVVEYNVTKGRYRYGLWDPLMPYLRKSPSGLLFYDYMSDTVWNISGGRKEPAFILDVKNKLPRDKQIEFSNGNLREWEKMQKSYQHVNLIPFSSMIFIMQRCWYGSKYDAMYIYNNKKGEMKRFNTSVIYDDIISKQTVWVAFSSRSGDCLVALGSIRDFTRNKRNNILANSQLFVNQMEIVKEDDNPILAIFKLKRNLQ